MKELKEPCKSAIANKRCLGCVGLAEKDWKEPQKCPYLPTAEDTIKTIKENLGGWNEWETNNWFMEKRVNGTTGL